MTALLGPASGMNLESHSQAAWVACELAPGGGERSADVCQPDRREALSAALLKVGREVLSGLGLSQVYCLVSRPMSLSFPGGLSPRTSGPRVQCPTRIVNNCGMMNKCPEKEPARHQDWSQGGLQSPAGALPVCCSWLMAVPWDSLKPDTLLEESLCEGGRPVRAGATQRPGSSKE